MSNAPKRLNQRRRSARGTLISLVFGLMTLNLALLVACEIVPRLRDPLFGDKHHKLLRRWDGQSPLVLMLGTSRTGYGFHGERVEAVLRPELGPVTAFNFGIPASGPVTHLIYLRRLIDAGIRPKVLFVEVLPSMLADHGTRSPMEGNWFQADRIRGSELDFVERYGLPRDRFASAWRQTYIHPWYALRFQLLARISVGWVPWRVRYDWGRGGDATGWITPVDQNVTKESYAKGLAQARYEYATILADLHLGGPAVDALRDIVKLCGEQQIPLKLVMMPEGEDFRAMYPPHVQERIQRFMTGLEQEFGIEVVDARAWVGNHQFTDSHHLIRSGAESFSEKLARDHLLPQGKGMR